MTDNADRIDRIIAEVIRREGGLVDDPADAGGITNHGVSLRYARGVGLDIDGDGDVDADDIELVTPPIAHALYLRDFYYLPKIDGLPEVIQPFMVDFAVNSGPGRAIITLQDVLGEVPDGTVGPKTRAAAVRAVDEAGPTLINYLVDARVAYVTALVARRPSQRRFLAGWVARAESFRERTH